MSKPHILKWMLSSLLLSTGGSFAQSQVPNIVVSIKPLHGLVSAVTEGVTEAELLIDGFTSPHDFTLKPSMASTLQDADIVFWIGEHLEAGLVTPISNLASSSHHVEFSSLYSGENEEHDDHDEHNDHEDHDDHDEEHEEHDEEHEEQAEASHDGHDHGGLEPHVWLDPHLAGQMVEQIAISMAELDAPNAETYHANAESFQQELLSLEAAISAKLAPVQSVPFVVFHDGYSRFVETFELSQTAFVANSEHQAPGARTVLDLKTKMQEQNVRCLFSEPQFDDKIALTLTEGTDIKQGALDPLGAAIPAGPDHYFQFLMAMADELVTCLNP